jgi:hypothetical protein
MGGLITAAAEPAYYAKTIEPATFDTPLAASGTIAFTAGEIHVLVGFFNADTLNEWRTPNSIALRILGRYGRMYCYVEYCTALWRADGDYPGGFSQEKNPVTGRLDLKGFEAGEGKSLRWSLVYDPKANDGDGAVIATVGDERAVCNVRPALRKDGASFNRFGLLPVMKTADAVGEVWLDDVEVNGVMETFDAPPDWDRRDNDRTYVTSEVRPKFDFGFSPTRHAGGRAAGELGGNVFRGDVRYPERMAYYGDRLAPLSLDKALVAEGRVAMRRGVSDSTSLIGFFDSKMSVKTEDSQASGLPRGFLGMAIEGPSSEGFFAYPVYRTANDGQNYADGADRPRIRPDGRSHEFRLVYEPNADAAGGVIRLTFDDAQVSLPVEAEDRVASGRFDRFGIVTTWIDGNGQHVFFDDLTYTASQE